MVVSKYSLMEQVRSLLSGGDPSASAKFEPRMVMSHLQSAINKKIRAEFFNTTLPSGETIPEGVILASYDSIAVTEYKGRSRAKLPAIPIGLRRNMGVFFVGPATENGEEPAPGTDTSVAIVVEASVGGEVYVTGTGEAVTGITVDGTVIECDDFIGQRVWVQRGGTLLPSFNPGEGGRYYTKLLSENKITLSSPMAEGEHIRIQTIPT